MEELELKHLRLLRERVEEIQGYARAYNEQLEDFVLELRESGASTRKIAEALGIGSSTVQGWTNNARRRRDS